MSTEDRYEKAPPDRGRRMWWCRECRHGGRYALVINCTVHDRWHDSQPVDKPVEN